MVAITVIQILQFRDRLFIPSDALDGAHELTRVKFSAADIDDGCVRYRSVVHRAREPLLDLAVATARPHREPCSKNVRGCCNRNHDDVRIGTPHLTEDAKRNIHDDSAASPVALTDCT